MEAYAQSKLAVVLYSFELAKVLKDSGVTVNSLDPGLLLNTRMVRDAFGDSNRNPELGANAQVRLALDEELDDVTGEFFCEGKLAKASEYAYNQSQQKQLWAFTEDVLKNRLL